MPGDVLLSRIIPHIRRGWVVAKNTDGRRQIASTEWIVFSGDEIVPRFLRQLLVSDTFHSSFMQTITGVGGSLSRANPAAVGEIKIPLPPLAVQKEIVAEIDGYQKVINGGRAVLEHYRPHIPIHPDWPTIELGEICAFKNGLNFNKGSSGLPQVEAEVKAYLEALRTRASIESLQSTPLTTGLVVPKEKIAANGDYNLSAERYREGAISNTAYPLVPVARFMKDGVKTLDPRTSPDEFFEL